MFFLKPGTLDDFDTIARKSNRRMAGERIFDTAPEAPGSRLHFICILILFDF